jgi:hypothetical protein
MKAARTTVKLAAEQGADLIALKAARTNPDDGITFNAKPLGHREKRQPFTDAVRRLILTNPGRQIRLSDSATCSPRSRDRASLKSPRPTLAMTISTGTRSFVFGWITASPARL